MRRELVGWLKSFSKRKEEGATLVEYGLMVALIAVVCIGVLTSLGLNISAVFTSVDNSINAAAGS